MKQGKGRTNIFVLFFFSSLTSVLVKPTKLSSPKRLWSVIQQQTKAIMLQLQRRVLYSDTEIRDAPWPTTTARLNKSDKLDRHRDTKKAEQRALKVHADAFWSHHSRRPNDLQEFNKFRSHRIFQATGLLVSFASTHQQATAYQSESEVLREQPSWNRMFDTYRMKSVCLPAPNRNVIEEWCKHGAVFEDYLNSDSDNHLQSNILSNSSNCCWLAASVPVDWYIGSKRIIVTYANTDVVVNIDFDNSKAYDQYMVVNFNKEGPKQNMQEVQHEDEYTKLLKRYHTTIRICRGCGVRGQPDINRAYEELLEFASQHPEFKEGIPGTCATCCDDGAFGTTVGMQEGCMLQ